MADNGATSKELLFEACRRDNTALLSSILEEAPLSSQAPAIASFLNETRDALSLTAIHLAAQSGSYDVLDIILDQEGVEIDGQEKRDGDTALHKAVRFCNGLSVDQWNEAGKAVIEILVDAGCDPRIKNNTKKRPVDILDPRNTACADVLRRAEMTIVMAPALNEEEDEEDDGGSESD